MIRKIQFPGTTKNYVLLSVLFGILTTILTYTGYGISNHVEQLPIILRSLDRTFLVNDFFTNAATHSIARLYYARFIAMLAGSGSNLPAVFLILTLCSNIAISLISFFFARDLFHNSPLAGICASALVMSVSTFRLGWHAIIFSGTLTPTTIAIPFALAAIWLSTRGKLVIGTVLCGIASIIHPQFGLEVGAILLGTFVLSLLIGKQKWTTDNLRAVILSLLVFIPFAVISILPQFSQRSIDPALFVYIIALFRHPHRFVPSTFGLSNYIYAAAFLYAVIVFYHHWRKDRKTSYSLPVAIIACTILFLCIGGYIFVEIFPMRIWVIAQTFRLLYLVQWLGLLLIAGTIADEKLQPSTRVLYLASALHPFALGIAALTQSLREWLGQKQISFGKFLDPGFVLLFNIAILGWFFHPQMESLLLIVYAVLILAFNAVPQKLYYSTILAGAIPVILLVNYQERLPYINHLDTVSRIKETVNFKMQSELGTQGDEMAEFSRQNTPEDSIFLTPPNWGQFRLLARRAVVVDFKAFPFADIAVEEWYRRLTDCYGIPASKGLAMEPELDANYRNMDDASLLALQKKYQVSYAILYRETPTRFEVRFQNDTYKVIQLNERK